MVVLRVFIWSCLLCLHFSVAMAAIPEDDKLTAKAVVLIEADTGKVIYEKAAEEKVYPASTTKIMTTLLALENGNLEDKITVSANAAATEGSSMQLVAGDQLRLADALYGVMMVSGNDAAIAVAEYLSGSVENFATLMTEKAQSIGATHTHFANSCGLPNPQHYTTAHDLAKIAAYAYKNPVFRTMIATQRKEMSWRNNEPPQLLENTNLLLGNYPGCNGMKTGYTDAAGECLVASAERDGVNLIAVVMHAAQDYRWYEAAALLDYGFERVKMETLFKKEEIGEYVRVYKGKEYHVKAHPIEDIRVPVLNDDKNRFSIVMDTPAVQAPVYGGQVVGKVNLLYRGKIVKQVDLVADQEVKAGFSVVAAIAGYFSDAVQFIIKIYKYLL